MLSWESLSVLFELAARFLSKKRSVASRTGKSDDGEDSEAREDLEPGDPRAARNPQLRWDANSARRPAAHPRGRAERAQRIQHAALALHRRPEPRAEEAPARRLLQPGQGRGGIRRHCGLRRRRRLAQGPRPHALPGTRGRNARGLRRPGAQLRPQLPLPLLHRRDARLAQQNGDDRLHPHDADGRGAWATTPRPWRDSSSRRYTRSCACP